MTKKYTNHMPIDEILSPERAEMLMMDALEGNIGDDDRSLLEIFLQKNPKDRTLFLEMTSQSVLIKADQSVVSPLHITTGVMQKIAELPTSLVLKTAVVKQPSGIFQLIFIYGLIISLFCAGLLILINALPMFKLIFWMFGYEEIEAFMALWHSIQSFWGGLGTAIFAFVKVVARMPLAWIIFAGTLLVVSGWITMMFAIYQPRVSKDYA